MTADEFRALALGLPEAIEAPHFGEPAFRVGKKMFATLSPDGTLAMMKVPQRERLVALLADHPEAFVEVKYTQKANAIGVHLAAVDPLLLRDLLTDSWAEVAPKRAQAALRQQLAE
jgi:hypothetical protein